MTRSKIQKQSNSLSARKSITIYFCDYFIYEFNLHLQRTLPAISSFVRHISADKTLKEVLAEKIPEEQENVKAFRKSHGATKVGEVTVDMVSDQAYNECESSK